MRYSYGYSYSGGISPGAAFALFLFIYLLFGFIYRGIFKKAGESGIAAFVPIYSTYILFKIAYGNGTRMFRLLIPFYNIFVMIGLHFKMAEVFGKGTGFGFGLWFLPVIFYGILGFGNSSYLGYDGQFVRVYPEHKIG